MYVSSHRVWVCRPLESHCEHKFHLCSLKCLRPHSQHILNPDQLDTDQVDLDQIDLHQIASHWANLMQIKIIHIKFRSDQVDPDQIDLHQTASHWANLMQIKIIHIKFRSHYRPTIQIKLIWIKLKWFKFMLLQCECNNSVNINLIGSIWCRSN